MKTRTILVVIVGFVLAFGVFLFWPKKSDQPDVRIEIVRRAFKKVREVVFFRIVGADGKRIRFTQFVTVSDNDVPPSSLADSLKTAKADEEGRELASLLTVKDNKEFGKSSPIGGTVWKVRVTVMTKMPMLECLRLMPSAMLQMPKSAKNLSWIWNRLDNSFDSWVIESDLITNSVAPAGEVTK